MSRNISLEFLYAQMDKKFGLKLQKAIEKTRQEMQGNDELVDISHYDQIIKQATNMDIRCHLDPELKGANVCLYTVGDGKSVESSREGDRLPMPMRGKEHQGGVDFQSGRVSGVFTELTSMLYISQAYVAPDSVFTDEELTAIILHEVGHVFMSMATLGDYMSLNYELTEGALAAAKKRPTGHQTQMTDIARLVEEKNDINAVLKELETDVTVTNARRVILGTFHKRHYQLGSRRNDKKRTEQMADFYCARQGYARASVTALYKIEKSGRGRHFMTPRECLCADTARLMARSRFGALSLLVYCFEFINDERTSEYDDLPERFAKKRQNLISTLRLKQGQLSPRAAKDILADIKTIEELEARLKHNPNMVAAIAYALNPLERQRQNQQQLENVLGKLLNNNGFVAASQFFALKGD